MSCPAQTFNNITPEVMTRIVAKAATAGLELKDPSGVSASGVISKDSITVEWVYDAPGASLTLTCTGKPFYAPCGTVNGKLAGLVESCLGVE